MLKFIIIGFLLVLSQNLNSQFEIDFLEKESTRLMLTDRDSFFIISDQIIYLSKKYKADTSLIEAYLTRAMMYQMAKDYKLAMIYNDSVLQIGNIPVKSKIRALMGKAEMMWKLSYPINEIVELLEESKKEAVRINDSIAISSIYFRFSNLYLDKGNYVKAIKVLVKSSEIRPKRLILPRMMDFAKLAKLFLFIGNIEKAEYYATKAYQIGVNNNFKINNRIIAILRGKIAVEKSEFEKADSLYNIALKSFYKINAKNDIFKTFVFLAELKLKENKLTDVKNYLKKADEFFPNVKNINTESKYYLTKANFFIANNEFDKALKYLDLADTIIGKSKSLVLKMDHLKTLALLQKKRNHYKESLKLTEQYHQLQDSLLRFKAAQSIMDIEGKYRANEKQKQIELLETKNKLYENKIKQEKLEKLFILGGGFIGFIFLLFLGITYYKVREKNKIIETALKQKDILLKEIHHRVKNNLQLISSLLNLQSRYIKDEKAKQVSWDGKNRVRAMSLIHQFLYQKDDLINLPLDEYFKKLVNELFEAYKTDKNRINVIFDIEKMELDVDRVIPLGLIFNELMTNVLKYAFTENAKGTIYITLYHTESELKLIVKDNGIGFDKRNNFSEDKTFGFTLINALLKKWDGKFIIKADDGTKATVIIPENKFKN